MTSALALYLQFITTRRRMELHIFYLTPFFCSTTQTGSLCFFSPHIITSRWCAIEIWTKTKVLFNIYVAYRAMFDPLPAINHASSKTVEWWIVQSEYISNCFWTLLKNCLETVWQDAHWNKQFFNRLLPFNRPFFLASQCQIGRFLC